MSEFHHYTEINRAFVPNYGDRYRHGEAISTAFVESTVNQVISKWMAKKQEVLDPAGRTCCRRSAQVLNDDLRDTGL